MIKETFENRGTSPARPTKVFALISDSRTEGSISKEGNSQLRDVLVRAAKVAVHTCNDPYLSTFYWRLRGEKNKPALVSRVATARKLLISIYHMLDREEEYDPPGSVIYPNYYVAQRG